MRAGLLACCFPLLLAACGSRALESWPPSAPAEPDAPATEGNPFEGVASPIYGEHAMWLSRPGHPSDVSRRLAATEVRSDGSYESSPFIPAAAPAVDCFYVYPTVALLGLPGNVATLKDPTPMLEPLEHQALRFNELCNVYAPLYHQATLASYLVAQRDEYLERAYRDVEEAFKHYMGQHNDGRPIVLLGHSQGGSMIATLLQRVFDVHPALRRQLVVAMPIGTPVYAPRGSSSTSTSRWET